MISWEFFNTMRVKLKITDIISYYYDVSIIVYCSVQLKNGNNADQFIRAFFNKLNLYTHSHKQKWQK